jgi:hypothetical protein
LAVVVRPRAALDTSALWGWSPRSELIRALDAGRFDGLWSEWILGELYYGLAWDWAAHKGTDDTQRRAMSASAHAMLRLLIPRLELITLRGAAVDRWPSLRDQEDQPVWATAVLGRATHVVSMNTRDFPPNTAAPGEPSRHVWEGIEYLEPQAFLAMVWADDPMDDEE